MRLREKKEKDKKLLEKRRTPLKKEKPDGRTEAPFNRDGYTHHYLL